MFFNFLQISRKSTIINHNINIILVLEIDFYNNLI
jgi:hypothetical protein